MPNPSLPLVHELIRSACSAPSVHNTQPWSWRVVDLTTVELYADRTRQLPATDPRGRDLVISCGAALNHLAVAADAFGLVAEIALLPDRGDADLLARIHLSPGHIESKAVDLLAALENRQTDRRGFSTWEVPMSRLRHLCETAAVAGAYALPLSDPWVRHRAEELLDQARRVQKADARVAAEQDAWVDRLGPDEVEGIPTTNTVPTQQTDAPHRASRFEPLGDLDDQELGLDGTDGLIAICTASDDERSWLRAGQTMSSLWLHATASGMVVTPVSQVIEVESTRRLLRRELFAFVGRPQILLRIGWPEVSRSPLSRTPRRSLEDVLRS